MMCNPIKVVFPLKLYLWQITHATEKTIYNPIQFWRSYRVVHLQRCWNWKKNWQERLERCWLKEWQPTQPLLSRSDGDRSYGRFGYQSSIDLQVAQGFFSSFH